MFSYFAKILKSFEYQSVLKVYYLTKNRQKWANLVKIRKTQIADYQHYIFFLFLLFSLPCTGSGYKDRLITCWLSAYFVFMGSQRVGKDNHISLFDTYIRLKKGVQVYHYTNTPIKNIVGFSKAVTKIQK